MIVALWAAMLVALEISQWLQTQGDATVYYLVGGPIFFGAFFVTTVLYVLAGWKRLQDFDRQGWLVLLSFIPLIGTVLVPLVLLVVPPSQGPNKFGYPIAARPFPERPETLDRKERGGEPPPRVVHCPLPLTLAACLAIVCV